MLDNIFSVKNEEEDGLYYKVFRIFGIKLKIFYMKKTLIKQLKRHEWYAASLCKGLCNSIITLITEFDPKSEMFCLKSENCVFILSKKFFQCDRQFILDYLSKCFCINSELVSIPELSVLNKKCSMYKEHIAKLQKGEIAWKYYITPATVKMNEQGKVVIQRQNEPPEEYIEGTSLSHYFYFKSMDEQKRILEKVFDYIFSTYEDKTTGKIPKYDFNISNIIINDKGLHFIDLNTQNKEYTDRTGIICQICFIELGNKEIYKYFIKYYNLKDESKKYKKRSLKIKIERKKQYLAYSKQKYFQAQNYLPEYDIDNACFENINT